MSYLFLFLFCILGSFSYAENWVIVANGPEISDCELTEHLQNQRIMALDGAANRLKKLSIFPDVILGDFDSIEDPSYWGISKTFREIDEGSLPYEGKHAVTIVPAKDQNHTDLEKAIMYCDALGASSILVIQATGGRMDHTLGNLGVLKKYDRQNRSLMIATETEAICYLHNQRMTIEEGEGKYCGIIGYPQAWMTTKGLAYNGDHYLLQLGVQESTCNTLIEAKASIAIEGEALLILPKSARLTIHPIN